MSEMQVLEREREKEEEEEETRSEPAVRVGRVRRMTRKLGRIVSEQAIPLLVGAISFVIAVDAWLSAKPLEWEQQRALASVSISSEAIAEGEDEITAVTTITIENVGQLTFAILDMHVTLELTGDLSAEWDRNSLLQASGSALPLGLRPFRLSDDREAQRTRFQFEESVKTWHVVDPGRTVEIKFVQPTRGSGWMSIAANVFTQPMLLKDIAKEITVDAMVDGVVRATMPEFGEGEVSELPVFPYSSGHILVIPKTLQ